MMTVWSSPPEAFSLFPSVPVSSARRRESNDPCAGGSVRVRVIAGGAYVLPRVAGAHVCRRCYRVCVVVFSGVVVSIYCYLLLVLKRIIFNMYSVYFNSGSVPL